MGKLRGVERQQEQHGFVQSLSLPASVSVSVFNTYTAVNVHQSLGFCEGYINQDISRMFEGLHRLLLRQVGKTNVKPALLLAGNPVHEVYPIPEFLQKHSVSSRLGSSGWSQVAARSLITGANLK